MVVSIFNQFLRGTDRNRMLQPFIFPTRGEFLIAALKRGRGSSRSLRSPRRQSSDIPLSSEGLGGLCWGLGSACAAVRGGQNTIPPPAEPRDCASCPAQQH